MKNQMDEIQKADQRIVSQEAVHLVADGNGKVIAILRRDPVSKKSLVYMVNEANCDDIATKVIK